MVLIPRPLCRAWGTCFHEVGGTNQLVETPKRCSGRRAETKPPFLYPGMRQVLLRALRAGAPLAEALSCEK